MKNHLQSHPLSTLCAYTMLGALIVIGLPGVLQYLPQDKWGWLLTQARTASVFAMAAAFVAAAFASMRATWHAEKARRAGRAYRHIMVLALAYAGACIALEVSVGELGARALGVRLPRIEVVALTLTFLAIAPRLVSYILSGLSGIADDTMSKSDETEHRRTLERIKVVNESTAQRIQAGVSNLEEERLARRVGGGAMAIGAAAALLGAGGAPAEARADYPVVDAQLASAPNELRPAIAELSTMAHEAPPAVRDEMALGPRHVEAYARMQRILDQNPNISNRRLARAASVHHATAKKWRAHYRAQQALAFAQNRELLEAA